MSVRTDLSPDRLREVFGNLCDQPRWVAWRSEKDAEGRIRKMPINPRTGGNAVTQWGDKVSKEEAATTWGTLEEALDRAEADGLAGVGIVLGDGLGGVDLDGCRDPETGEVTGWAMRWVGRFGTYTEVSPSGTGLKMLALDPPEDLEGGEIAMDAPWVWGKRPAVEVHPRGRFYTVTLRHLEGTPTEIHSTPDAWQQAAAELEISGTRSRSNGRPAGAPTYEYEPEHTDVLPVRLLEVMKHDRGLRQLWHEGTATGDTTGSGLDASLISRMVRAGFEDQEIEGAARNFPHGRIYSGDSKLSADEKDRQIRRLIEKARSRWGEENREGGEADDRWAGAEIWTAGDLMRADLPEPTWNAVGFLPEHSVGGFGALFDTGKTWVALQSALDMGLGRPLFDHFSVPKPLRSLVIMGEGTPITTRARLHTLARAVGANPDEVEGMIYVVHGLDMVLGDPGDDRHLRHTIRKLDIDIVWIDPFAEFFSGAEKSSEDLLSALKPLRQIRDDLGTSIYLMLHTRQISDEDTGRPPGIRWRGNTALPGWADIGYTLSGPGRQDIRVQKAKSRDCVVEEDFILRWTEGETEVGETLRLVHEDESDIISSGEDLSPAVERGVQRIREALTRHGPNSVSFFTGRSSKEGAVSGGREVLERALEQMEATRAVYVDRKSRFAKNRHTVMWYWQAADRGYPEQDEQEGLFDE